MKSVKIRTSIIIKLAYLYLVIPIVIFFCGWLKWYYAVIFSGAIIEALMLAFSTDSGTKEHLEIPLSALMLRVCVSFAWVYASGIGGFVWQRADWHARNATLHDLINNSWPIVFENGGGLSYYLCYWMVPAVFGKIFGWEVANIVLFFWSIIGIILILILLTDHFKDNDGKISFPQVAIITAFMVLWGGLNLIGQFIVFAKGHGSMSLGSIYGWSKYQYTPNNALLEWVFNQAIPAWIVGALFLNERKQKNPQNYGILIMLLIPFSPFAALGFIPLLFSDIFAYNRKKILSTQNVLATVSILPVFFAYYTCNTAISGESGMSRIGLFRLDHGSLLYGFLVLTVFLCLEVLIYALLIWKKNRNDRMFWTVVIWLLIIPLIRIGPSRDFIMRGSIIPLFMLMTYVCETLTDKKFRENKFLYPALILSLAIGFYSGAGDFILTAINTADPQIENIADDVGSMNNKDLDWWNDYMNATSYIAPNAEEKFFYKKLAR